MFIGHFAVGMAAKRVAPRTSLAILFAAAQLLDLIWPILVLAGLEEVRVHPGDTAFTPLDFESYPWSHSLLMAALYAVAFALLYRARTHYGRGAWAAGALVLSHWVLDWASHRPDLPLLPGGPKVGLGLWGSVPATLAVEGLLFAAGIYLYATATRPRDWTGSAALWALLLLLVALYLGALLGPPPPSGRAVAAAALAMWLLLPWAAWIDAHREPVLERASRPGVDGRAQT